MAKFTTDVIGTCAFGLECNSLNNTESEFRRMGTAVLNPSISTALSKVVRTFFPRMFTALKLRTFPAEVDQFFMGIVKQTIEFRDANRVHRNDFIQLLLEIRNQQRQENATSNTVELTEELIAAQVSAGFVDLLLWRSSYALSTLSVIRCSCSSWPDSKRRPPRWVFSCTRWPSTRTSRIACTTRSMRRSKNTGYRYLTKLFHRWTT